MARARHAMYVHPLRSKGVVVGVPVAAAVAFGAHTVLGVAPVSEQHDTQASSSATGASGEWSGAPVQTYGLAPTPPPTTLGLLSAPATGRGAGSTASGTAPTSSVPSTAPVTHHADAAPQTVPIAKPAAPARSLMTFSPAAAAPAAAPVHEAEAPAPAPVETPAAETPAAAAPAAHEDAAPSGGGSAGGSLLGVQLGGAKVSVLSFGS